MSMNDDDLLRYSRQIMLPEIEIAGQEKLLAAKVLVVGLGGLGSPAALYLAATGVGHLVLADFDLVDLSNLQRHGTGDIGRLKVDSARDAIHELNPNTRVTCISVRLDDESLRDIITDIDLVVDGSDNFATRYRLKAIEVRVVDNDLEKAMRVLKKKIQNDGLFKRLKLKKSYEKPSEYRRRKQREAMRRKRIAAAKAYYRR